MRSKLSTLTVLFLGLAACDGTVHDVGDLGEPLIVLHGRLSGQTPDRIPEHLLGGVTWASFPSRVIDCVAEASDEAQAQACSDLISAPIQEAGQCLDRAVTEADELACIEALSTQQPWLGSPPDAVKVEPRFPVSFDYPLRALPSTGVLPFHDGVRFGLALLQIYVDVDQDQQINFSLMSYLRAADHGGFDVPMASQVEGAGGSITLLYLEGEVTPGLSRIITASFPGCPDLPQGYSLVRRGSDTCELVATDEVLFDLELQDSFLVREHVCDQTASFRPPQVRPADTVLCIDGQYAAVEVDAERFCGVERYYLRGCEHDPECAVPEWDLTSAPPAWWPCQSSRSLTLSDAAGGLTAAANDPLFEISYDAGAATYAPGELRVSFLYEGETTWSSYSPLDLELDDQDGDQLFSAGDRLLVSESWQSFFDDTLEGADVTVRLLQQIDDTSSSLVGEFTWSP